MWPDLDVRDAVIVTVAVNINVGRIESARPAATAQGGSGSCCGRIPLDRTHQGEKSGRIHHPQILGNNFKQVNDKPHGAVVLNI